VIGWETAIAVAAVCIVVEGFFSGSEIAMVSANRALLRRKSQAGDLGAQLVEKFLQKPQVLLATTLIGTNLGTVTFSVTIALVLLSRDVSNSEVLAVVLVTPFTLLLAEVVPKTLFQHNADRLVTRIVYPLRVASILFAPGVWLMSQFAGGMTRLLGTEKERAFVTRDELALLIEA
jgi:CBS domain containing-hemolysin-like protein